jgi:hypothetical protein
MADAITALIQLAPSLAKLGGEIVAATDKAQANTQLIQFQQALIGLNSLIASVQQEKATLLQQKNHAEEELKRMKDWSAEKQRYKLAPVYRGVMGYALQKAMSNGEAPHYLCANCFTSGQKSFLSPGQQKGPDLPVECAICEFAAWTHFRNVGKSVYAEDISQ